jgi:hypothetical protein
MVRDRASVWCDLSPMAHVSSVALNHERKQAQRYKVLWCNLIAAQMASEMRVDENGQKDQMALSNSQGIGLLAVGAQPLSMETKHYSKKEMERFSPHIPDGAAPGDISYDHITAQFVGCQLDDGRQTGRSEPDE